MKFSYFKRECSMVIQNWLRYDDDVQDPADLDLDPYENLIEILIRKKFYLISTQVRDL